jgi:exosortase
MSVTATPISEKSTLRTYAFVLGVLLLLCYWRTIAGTVQHLYQGEDMTHSFVAPFVAAYVIWSRRSHWPSHAMMPDIWGFAPLLAGTGLAMIGALGSSSTLLLLALWISLIGCITVIGGRPALRFFAFPLLLLLFMFPLPGPLYSKVTLPLQLLASRGAELSFHLLGMKAVRHGDIIELPSQMLGIAEACSGLRSLVTLAFFSLIYSYWNEPSKWRRRILVTASVPASILMNILRITATGLLGEWNRTYTQGVWHEMLGYAALIAGFCCVWILHLVIKGFGYRNITNA